MMEGLGPIPIPRVDLSPHDLTASRDELISKHRARVAELVGRYPELGEDLATRQARPARAEHISNPSNRRRQWIFRMPSNIFKQFRIRVQKVPNQPAKPQVLFCRCGFASCFGTFLQALSEPLTSCFGT